jgi:hypothetical protein
MSFKGTVVEAGAERSSGDLVLVDHHVKAFVEAAPGVGLDRAQASNLFAVEVVPLVIEVDALFDQTPGPAAGRRIDATR